MRVTGSGKEITKVYNDIVRGYSMLRDARVPNLNLSKNHHIIIGGVVMFHFPFHLIPHSYPSLLGHPKPLKVRLLDQSLKV